MSYHKWWSLLTIDDTAMIQGLWLSIGMIVGFFGSIVLVKQFRKWERRNWRESREDMK